MGDLVAQTREHFKKCNSNSGQDTGEFSFIVPMADALRYTHPRIKSSITVSLVFLGSLGGKCNRAWD